LCAGGLTYGQNKEANRCRKRAAPFYHCGGPPFTLQFKPEDIPYRVTGVNCVYPLVSILGLRWSELV
jgi:hypothetical protein